MDAGTGTGKKNGYRGGAPRTSFAKEVPHVLGAEHSQTRIHERIYDDFAAFGKMFEAWVEDEECQKIEVERHNFYVWEREELLYVDDPVDEDALRKELAAKMADAGEEKII